MYLAQMLMTPVKPLWAEEAKRNPLSEGRKISNDQRSAKALSMVYSAIGDTPTRMPKIRNALIEKFGVEREQSSLRQTFLRWKARGFAELAGDPRHFEWRITEEGKRFIDEWGDEA